MNKCEGVVLLKQWKQGNTRLSKNPKETSRNRGLFYSYEMNIKNNYQKRRGEQTSFPTGEIIEPNRKYLESNVFYPLSNLLKGIIKEKYWISG